MSIFRRETLRIALELILKWTLKSTLKSIFKLNMKSRTSFTRNKWNHPVTTQMFRTWSATNDIYRRVTIIILWLYESIIFPICPTLFSMTFSIRD